MEGNRTRFSSDLLFLWTATTTFRRRLDVVPHAQTPMPLGSLNCESLSLLASIIVLIVVRTDVGAAVAACPDGIRAPQVGSPLKHQRQVSPARL
jgi:hypothetical protein